MRLSRQLTEREKTLERSLKRRVKAIGGICLKLVTIHISGLPDRLILLPRGVAIFVEVKETKKKPSLIQNYMIKKLKKLGFPVHVVDSTYIIDEILKDYE